MHDSKIRDKHFKIMTMNNPMYNSEIAKKQGKKMKGNKNPMKRPEVIKKVSGKNHWLYNKPKEDHPFFGEKHTEEAKRKNSQAHAGKNHPNYGKFGPETSGWKGGLSNEPYCEIWKDKEYKQDIRCRDNNECQNPDCWKNTKRLTIHHINYIKKDCDPWNLITLCISCNSRANKNREWHINFYQNIMAENN